MTGFTIEYPETLAEALTLLDPDDPSVRPLGGGTALMLMIKSQLFHPTRLVCLSKVADQIRSCQRDDGWIRIGAMTTFTQLEHSEIIANSFPIIPEAMKNLANPRVRNVATVGGNLAHGDPHLDLPPIWAALGAEALVLGAEGERSVKVQDIFKGFYETDIADGELITEIRVPLRPSWRSTYSKVTTRAVHDWPAIGIAITASFDGDRIEDICIVLSAAVEAPMRLKRTEDALRGERVDADSLAHAGDVAVAEAPMEEDSRGSANYKAHLLKIYLARAINKIRKA